MTRARPLVGITMYGPEGELGAWSLPGAYADAVAMAGGNPVLLQPTSLEPAELVAGLDALVLAGGGDIDPALHGGGAHPTLYGVSPARDAFELELARAALADAELPLLGICRGMQMMNVALGGDLELHLPDARGDAVEHRKPPRVATFHGVAVEPASPLGEIYGEREFPVCSWHHQGVRTLGAGLVAVAWAPDGVVEGIVRERGRFALGVQWHPELQVADDPLQRRLFEALVRAARSR
jgi:gamma-glutamyl-gamma-aminobutyrate hydrolase PuuD